MKQTLANILVEKYSTHPVYLAVNPFRTNAMDAAEQLLAIAVAAMYTELEANGWDKDKVAPYPKGGSGNYFIQLGRHELCNAITCWVKSTQSPYEPCIVVASAKRLENYIEECRNMAAHQYDMFTLKLVEKIGACDSASIEGNHVWSESVLTVHKGALTEVWKTHVIINQSKYGKLFNQWPSRKLKIKAISI